MLGFIVLVLLLSLASKTVVAYRNPNPWEMEYYGYDSNDPADVQEFYEQRNRNALDTDDIISG